MRSAAAYPQCGQVIIETDLMTPILDTMPIGLFTVENAGSRASSCRPAHALSNCIRFSHRRPREGADQPSLQCGKAATCFMLNTKNTIIAIFVLVSLFTAGSETNALVDAPASRSGQSTCEARRPSRVALNLNARCRKGRDIAEVAIGQTGIDRPIILRSNDFFR